jgi:hypothetical protein
VLAGPRSDFMKEILGRQWGLNRHSSGGSDAVRHTADRRAASLDTAPHVEEDRVIGSTSRGLWSSARRRGIPQVLSRIRRLPSPALLISTIALFVAIGGISWAAATIGTSDIKNGAVTTKKLHNNAVSTKKIKNNAVTGAKAKESSFAQVPDAAHADSADNATNATNATTARSYVLFAHVSATGTVDTANSQGIASSNITHPFMGTYCFSGLSFAPKGFSFVGEDTPAVASDAIAEFNTANTFCPAGTQVDLEVSTDAGAYVNKPFFVAFYG